MGGEELWRFPRMGKGQLGREKEWRRKVRVGLGAEVTVVALDNATTRKCQIWGFFLLSVRWFGLCYFHHKAKQAGGFRGLDDRGEN